MSSLKNKTLSQDWTSFCSELAIIETTSKNYHAQLCLQCKNISMTEALAENRPTAADQYLTELPEVILFTDNTSAVRFVLLNGASIVGFLNALRQGDYGTSRLIITSGIALGLPESDRNAVLKMLGIPQAILLGNTFAW